jgi:futalosine hydrolase
VHDSDRRLLVVVASAGEARAVLRGFGNPEVGLTSWVSLAVDARADLVLTGIGKANAAGAVARALDVSRHAAVVNLGIAGALPGGGLAIGDVLLGTASVFADEGAQTPSAFLDCDALGFPIGDFPHGAVPCSLDTRDGFGAALEKLFPKRGAIATVSTCSGTDALARAIAERTSALAEGMEGAAAALVCHRVGVPFGEVRVISNTTGDRGSQVWDIPRAFSVLAAAAGSVRDAALTM